MEVIRRELEKIAGDKYVVTKDKPEYWAYTFGDATMYRSNPDIVVYPGNTEEIQNIVKLANEHNVPVTTGAGLTGLSGGSVVLKGIMMNVTRLRSVLDIDPISKTVVTQPGISCLALNTKLAEQGMVVPVAPASQAVSTVGANIAEASGGTWGMSKGTFKNYLLALKAVDGEGNLFTTGYRCAKVSVGPDITSLMLGSEGTLGVITELTFRCDYLPEDIWTIRCSFVDESVLQKIHETIAERRINLYSFEYMDTRMMSCFGKKNMLLLLQTAGSKNEAKEIAQRLIAELKKLNPIELKFTNNPKEADELYTERQSCIGALAKFDRKKPVIVQFDPVLPIRKFAIGTAKMRELAKKYGLEIIIFGHAGDGNLHPSIVIADDIEEKKKARSLVREFDEWVEGEGGCYSGEHAVGFFLGRSRDKLSPTTAGYVRKIKQAFDPKGILNPGKVVNIVEPGLEISPILPEYQDIGQLAVLCNKCHQCKNDSPAFRGVPFEHNTIRGRIAMVDAAMRGKVSFAAIKPFIQEMAPWTENMTCPTFIKSEMKNLIALTAKAAKSSGQEIAISG